MSNILEIKDLCFSFPSAYGEFNALTGANLSVEEGKTVGIVGESGAGKSLLANTILGFVIKPGKIKGGSVLWHGHNSLDYSENQKRQLRGRQISMVFQDPFTSLDPAFTVGGQLKELMHLYYGYRGREAGQRSLELLQLVGISEPKKRMRQYPYEFSGGMRQRIMIAMALAGRPKLLIADEPTAELDTTTQAQILEILKNVQKESGLSMIFISHDLSVAAVMADTIYVMFGGGMVESAPAKKLFANPCHPYTKNLFASHFSLENGWNTRLYSPAVAETYSPDYKGCPYALRCSKCMKVCLRFRPPDFQISAGHLTACWLFDKRAGDTEL